MLIAAALIVTAEVIVRKAIPDSLALFSDVGKFFGEDVGSTAARAGDWVREHWAFSGSVPQT
ncbi:MAG: hypothetical protein JSS20_15505, partial [Proteobacteria bacterium]|nr:hypothetical protein [Pseudomonadota bacterium]